MKQIRADVFETNSSSTHAICISNKKPDLPTYPVRFGHGEFGWAQETFCDVYDRAAYLNEAIDCFDDAEEYRDKLKSILDKYHITYEFEPRHLFDSIDHGYETKEFIDAVFSDEQLLLRYLFSDDSFIVTGNDNDGQDLINEILYNGNDPWEDGVELDPKYKDFDIYWKGN